MLKSVCACVCVCVSGQERRQKKKPNKKGILNLREHLLFVQQKQPAPGTLGPLLQHQGEVLHALDGQLLLQGQDHVLRNLTTRRDGGGGLHCQQNSELQVLYLTIIPIIPLFKCYKNNKPGLV